MTRGEIRSIASAETDAERLLIEAAQKDPTRFAELYEMNFDRVYAFIARRIRDRNEVEDLTSDVFHQALAALPRFEWRGVPFAAWLFRIATNAVIDRAKRAAKETELEHVENIPDVSSQDIEDAEQKARLFRLVDLLPEDQRRVIVLRFAEEKSIRDVSNELQRSEGAIKQLQFRALQNLRAMEFGESGRQPRNRTGKKNG
jgi:RNA polymerase sigma-70 factor (ECF subfamily)